MTKDNPHQCDSVYPSPNGQIYRCMLPEDHDEPEHMWYTIWHEEESGDPMQ